MPEFWGKNRLALAAVCLVAAAVCAGVVLRQNEISATANTDTPNAPIGVARGINPGRVVWSYDPAACLWSGNKNGTHWRDSNMLSRLRQWLE